MSGRLIWLHDDALRLDLYGRCDGEPVVYVLDEALVRYRCYGLKRLGFIFECLAELEIEAFEGALVPSLRALAERHGAGEIVTVATACPLIRGAIAELRDGLAVTVIEPPPITAIEGKVDLKRFSRFWKKAERSAMQGPEERSQGGLFDSERG